VKKIVATLLVAGILVIGATSQTASAEPLLAKIVGFVFSPAVGALEIIKGAGETAVKLFTLGQAENLKWRAVGDGIWNGICRPFEEAGNLLSGNDLYIREIGENNAIADALGLPTTFGVFGAGIASAGYNLEIWGSGPFEEGVEWLGALIGVGTGVAVQAVGSGSD